MRRGQITDGLNTDVIFFSHTLAAAGGGATSVQLDTDLNNVLANLGDALGNDLQDDDGGSDTSVGVYCSPNLPFPVYKSENKPYIIPGGYALYALVSRRYYSSGLSSVTGIDIEYLHNGCPADASSNQIKFSISGNRVRLSADGGSTWGLASVDLSTLAENECFRMRNIIGGNAYVAIGRRTAAALPGGDQTDTLTVNDDQWAVGFGKIGGGSSTFTPYYLDDLSAYRIAVPVVYHAETLSPSDYLVYIAQTLYGVSDYDRSGVISRVTEVNVATFDVLPEHDVLHVTRTSTGACAITLKNSCKDSGKVYWFKDAGFNCNTNNITITPESGQIEDGGALGTLATLNVDGESIGYYTDGTDWYQVT